MSPGETALVVGVSGVAGAVGALLGLGGGVLIVPMLTIGLGVAVDEARGTSLIAVLATSAAGSVAQDKGRIADPRLIAHLSVTTVLGGIAGGWLAAYVPDRVVYALFALMTAWALVRLRSRLRADPTKPATGERPGAGRSVSAGAAPSTESTSASGATSTSTSSTDDEGGAGGASTISTASTRTSTSEGAARASTSTSASGPGSSGPSTSTATSGPGASDAGSRDAGPSSSAGTSTSASAGAWPVAWPTGLVGSSLAGVASGLLGIGGAPIQVPVMTEVMRVPLPVAFATSNVMTGITVAASAAVYLARGQIRADLLGPCVLAAGAGALLGGWLAPRMRSPRPLVALFLVILLYLTGRMLWKAIAPAA